MRTLKELNDEYGYKYDETFYSLNKIHPTHKKWAAAAWEIENVYGHVENEVCSLGKARELVTAIIEKYATEKATKSDAVQGCDASEAK